MVFVLVLASASALSLVGVGVGVGGVVEVEDVDGWWRPETDCVCSRDKHTDRPGGGSRWGILLGFN